MPVCDDQWYYVIMHAVFAIVFQSVTGLKGRSSTPLLGMVIAGFKGVEIVLPCNPSDERYLHYWQFWLDRQPSICSKLSRD